MVAFERKFSALKELENGSPITGKPPKCLPDMRKEYERYYSSQKKKDNNKLEEMVKLWQKRVLWWNKEFNTQKTKNKKKKTILSDTSWKRETEPKSPDREITVTENARIGHSSISGQTLLGDGLAVPGVLVELTGDPTKTGTRTTVTNEHGRFVFRNIIPGSYQLRAELDGFKSKVPKKLRVLHGRNSHVPIIMKTGTIKQVVILPSQFVKAGIRNGDRRSGTQNTWTTAMSIDMADARTDTSKSSKILFKAGDPETSYMKELNKAAPEKAFDVYMKLKATYGRSPAFYLDCSDYFCKQNRLDTGLQVLSNITELKLSSSFFLRVYGHRLAGLGYLKRSVEIFRQVLLIKPGDPQSYRDLALVLAQAGRYKEAVALLYEVVTRDWERNTRPVKQDWQQGTRSFQQDLYWNASYFPGDWRQNERSGDIELIALMEMNRIITKAGKSLDIDIDPRLVKLLDVDIRVVMSWDSGCADIDLYVHEPGGDKGSYINRNTRIGGRLSRDNARGYGPEEYVLKNAVPGKYIIEGDYFSITGDKNPGPITVTVDIFTNYGRVNEEKKSISLRLSTVDKTHVIGEFEIKTQ